MIKKTLLYYVFMIFGVAAGVLAKDLPLITINQFISHQALDESVKGIESAFKARGILSQYELKFANSHGSIANCSQIAKHQAALNPKVMISVATPSAQATFKVLPNDSLLAFVAVTDPNSAGLDAAKNVIGVVDQPPLKELLAVTHKVLPSVKKLGVLYSHGEVNSVNAVKLLEELAKEFGWQVIKFSISSIADVPLAMHDLTETADVIYLPQDNTVFSAIDAIVRIANKAKVPVISSVPSTIDNKVLLALGTDYFSDGQQLGNMVADYLSGKSNIGIIRPSGSVLKVNKAVAKYFGIVIPSGLD